MDSQYEQISNLYKKATQTIGKTPEQWGNFLKTASFMYKYPFPDQVLIHTQAPNITACATEEQYHRAKQSVKPDAKKIALMNWDKHSPSLRYVFDYRDTVPMNKEQPAPSVWKIEKEHWSIIKTALEEQFPPDEHPTNGSGLLRSIKAYVDQNIDESFEHFIGKEADTLLDGLDRLSIKVAYRETITSSVQYMVLNRCGLNASKVISEDDLRSITEFNTEESLTSIGTAISGLSQGFLREIERIVKKYNREKDTPDLANQRKTEYTNSNEFNDLKRERIDDNGRTDLQQRRKVLTSEPEIQAGGRERIRANRQVRQDETKLSEGAQARPLLLSDDDRNIVAPFGKNRPGSIGDGGQNRVEPSREGRDKRSSKSIQSDGVGAGNELFSSTSGGNHSDGAYLQLKLENQNKDEKNAVSHSSAFFSRQNQPDRKEQGIVSIRQLLKQFVHIQPEGHPESANPKKTSEKKDTDKELLNSPKPPINSIRQTKNYQIHDDSSASDGEKTRFRKNINAIETLKKIESENRFATLDEQEVLNQYVGWGGLSQAFNPESAAWKKEYLELKEILTPSEYQSARSSTLNAHYTTPEVVKAIYNGIEKIGVIPQTILEPAMGTGRFFGLLPPKMQSSRLYGVELDDLTGRIAKQLYPDADITVSGYEKTNRESMFDLVVGNVPFGAYQVSDPKYDKHKFPIHDYFLAKSIDQLRPGGVMAMITSYHTMDKKDSKLRTYLAERGDLLGAIRLPNNAFKASAGTTVTTDILFFQKRAEILEQIPDWVNIDKNADGIPLNNYFLKHPNMVLGRMERFRNMYGNENETGCLPLEGEILSEQLNKAIQNLDAPNERLLQQLRNDEQEIDDTPLLNPVPEGRNYSYTIVDEKLYYCEGEKLIPVEQNETTCNRIYGLMQIRDCSRELIQLQLDPQTTDVSIIQKQKQLNSLYDDFTKKYGLINSSANKKAFQEDSSYPLLSSLEILDEDGNLQSKADMFTKRTIMAHQPVTHVDTAYEALTVSIREKGHIDLHYMASLLDKQDNIPQIVSDLQGIIFKDPETGPFDFDQKWYEGWKTEDEYLSGNVRKKLEKAREAAIEHPEFSINVKALEKVQPKDLSAAEIEVRIGAPWVDPEIYAQFLFELLKTPEVYQDRIKVLYCKATGQWCIDGKKVNFTNPLATSRYGTPRCDAYTIFEDLLNQRDSKVYDPQVKNGERTYVLNEKETKVASMNQDMINEEFKEWIFKSPERREQLCKKYNELYNAIRPREYDGSHLRLAGINPEVHLRPHQLNAVARILYGGNTLLAHCVGAGKTYPAIAGAMEAKRLGLAHKSLFVVPNHLTEQWGKDILRLYPGANILVATKDDFTKQKRKRLCARIATGNYDAIVIGHTQFEKIPLSQERQKADIQKQISELIDSIAEAKSEKMERFTIKQMESMKKRLEKKMDDLNNTSRKDDVVTFEELGIDRLVVDESQAFKNLYFSTNMSNLSGMSQSASQRASDMYQKCRYLDDITGGKGITFATATPISNTMAELYTNMRYLQSDLLEQLNISNFDSWAANFAKKTVGYEITPDAKGFRMKTRFSKFYNLPELINLWKESADIQTEDMLNLPTPKINYETVTTEATKFQKEYIQELAKRSEVMLSI